jgi:hypothetical protein
MILFPSFFPILEGNPGNRAFFYFFWTWKFFYKKIQKKIWNFFFEKMCSSLGEVTLMTD